MTENSKIFDQISSKTKLRSLYAERESLAEQLENVENYLAMKEVELRRLRDEIAEATAYKSAELLPVLNGVLDNIDRLERARTQS